MGGTVGRGVSQQAECGTSGDETAYWLELIVESGRLPIENLENLMQETNELIAIFVASIKTSQSRD